MSSPVASGSSAAQWETDPRPARRRHRSRRGTARSNPRKCRHGGSRDTIPERKTQPSRSGAVAFAMRPVATGAVAGIELQAPSPEIKTASDSRPGGAGIQDGSIAFASQFPIPAERFDVSQQVASVLLWPIRRAVEQPGKRRHHGIRHHAARVVEMRELPVGRPHRAFAGQVGADAASPPKLRIIEHRFPSQSDRAETPDVAIEIADLLRVAIGAAIPT